MLRTHICNLYASKTTTLYLLMLLIILNAP